MIDLASFENAPLQGGFFINEVECTREPIVDALGREAIAQTRIVERGFYVLIRVGLSREELSVTLYHEVLEAATVASLHAPASVMNFNEADFERAAHDAHDKFGEASPENLNRMLQSFRFRRK